MKFADTGESVEVHSLIWAVPKSDPGAKPKLTVIVFQGGLRTVTNGDLASEYLFGDVVRVPDVEIV